MTDLAAAMPRWEFYVLILRRSAELRPPHDLSRRGDLYREHRPVDGLAGRFPAPCRGGRAQPSARPDGHSDRGGAGVYDRRRAADATAGPDVADSRRRQAPSRGRCTRGEGLRCLPPGSGGVSVNGEPKERIGMAEAV